MMKHKYLAYLRRQLLTGLLVLFPLIVTIFGISIIFNFVNKIGSPIFINILKISGTGFLLDHAVFPLILPAVNLILTVAVLILIGIVSTSVFGRIMFMRFEAFLLRIPVVKSIYGATRQIIDTFKDAGKGNFQKVVLVEYPRKGVLVMGFIAAKCPLETSEEEKKGEYVSVFIPTTPNPTSGFVIIVPKDSVTELDYSVEDAFKFIVSSGLIAEPLRRPPLPKD